MFKCSQNLEDNTSYRRLNSSDFEDYPKRGRQTRLEWVRVSVLRAIVPRNGASYSHCYTASNTIWRCRHFRNSRWLLESDSRLPLQKSVLLLFDLKIEGTSSFCFPKGTFLRELTTCEFSVHGPELKHQTTNLCERVYLLNLKIQDGDLCAWRIIQKRKKRNRQTVGVRPDHPWPLSYLTVGIISTIFEFYKTFHSGVRT